MPDPAFDSLVIAGQIELLGGSVPSTDPRFPGAVFKLQPGYDTGAQSPSVDFLSSLILDGEVPVGRRASNRTVTLPVNIHAPDFATLAAAREALLAAVDQPQWQLTWTRAQGADPAQYPLILDCFRAQQAQVQGGGLDEFNINPVDAVTLTFPALPYGRSDAAVQVPVLAPVPGDSAPPAAVVLDTYATVSGTNFTRDTTHFVAGNASAKWSHAGDLLPDYTATFASKNLTGLTAFSVWVGIGADFPAGYANPTTISVVLKDSSNRNLIFGITRTLTPSASSSSPKWTLVSAPIPQGRAFTYSAVTGYTLNVTNTGFTGGAAFNYNTWYNQPTANPGSLQSSPSARGYVYSLPAVTGTARAPLKITAQQPGVTAKTTFSTPGPFQYTVPLNLSSPVLDVMCEAASGPGKSQTSAGQGGGGGGGENAREATLSVTPGAICNGVVGAGGTPQTSISTLAITTAGLPSGTVGSAYNGYAGAFLKLIDFNFLTGQLTTFDGGISTWVGAGNCNASATSAQFRSGTGAMVMTSIAAGLMDAAHCTAANIATQGKACAAGDTINCRAYFKAAVSARNCQVGATFYTSGGALISTVLAAGGATDSTTGWTFVQGQVTAPATSAFCRLTCQVNATGAASEVHWVDDAMLGPASLSAAITQWEALTGRAMNVRREYFGAGVYGTGSFLITTDLSADAAAGRKVCLTLRPPYNPTSSTDRTNMATFLDSCKAAGLDMDVTLWHEPFYSGLTASQYQAMINFYGPTVRSRYPLVFCTATSAVQNNGENSYFVAGGFDKVATDYYAQAYASGTRLDTAASVADSNSPPLPFGVWELNASTDATSGQTVDQATNYFGYLQQYFNNREAAGLANAELLLFNADTNAGQETPLTDPTDFRLPLWNSLYDSASIAQLTATGGAGGYTFAVAAGPSLPAGLSLDADTGHITGVPTAAAVTTVNFQVTDSAGAVATAALVIRVVTAATLAITTTTLPGGSVGASYTATLRATGGTTPYTWSLAAGTLPAGLSLNSSTGVISGVPTAAVTNRALTLQVNDSAAHVDTQNVTLTIGTATVSSKPLFGVNNGSANPPVSWQPIYDFCFKPGQSFGYRNYGPAGTMPTAWNTGVTVDSQATFALFSWKPSIASILNGSLDSQISQWAKSCQAQWAKNPGSIWVSLWHEGDHGSTTTAPTSSDILHLHAYVYPRFKALAPDVPYGQIFTALAVTQNPTAWVSCPANVSGGRVLDYYAIDGYANTDRKASQVLTPAFNAIKSVVPTAKLAIAENNCENEADRAQWFADAWQIALNSNCLFFFPFFWNAGGPGGGNISWQTSDTATQNEIRTIAQAAAPSGSVALGADPPAVDGGDSSFTSDLGTVVLAHGGKAALSSTGGLGGTGSANTSHHDGGAGAAGASGAGGSGLGTPYTVCSAAITSPATTTDPVPVTHAVAAGDAIAVMTTGNNGAPSSVTDSKSNTYVQAVGNNASGLDTYIFTCLNAIALTTSDTITVHWSFSGGTHSILARGCSGVLTSSALDVSVSATGTSTSPSTGSSGTLAQASEWVIMLTSTANGGGSPAALTGGFASVLIQHPGSGPYSAVSEQVVATTTAITGGETITSATWCAAMISLMAAPVSSGGYGGGGGAAASAAAAGAAGSTSSGGQGAAGFGSGGSGSLVPDDPPSDGTGPGGGGGGAASSGPALTGGKGADGKVVITRTTTVEQFSTLILHMAGPDAPDSFSPLVTLGATSVPADGATEYTVPQLVAGVNADFDGTYSIVAVADVLAASSQPRTVQVTVNQYEASGGRSYQVSRSRTFIPDGDGAAQQPVVNGIVEIGELTLPPKDVALDNTAGFYTVQILDDNASDLWLDIMLCDTQGQLVILSDSRPNANLIYYLDEPATNRDIGRILATNTDRTAAVSVMDRCERISGGPLTVYPATSNSLLAYSVEGAPELRLEYIPRWLKDRTS
jgi:Putative Ig domain